MSEGTIHDPGNESSSDGVRADELVRELVADLAPVKPIPPVRAAVAGVVGVWLAVAALGVGIKGLRPDWLEAFLAPLGPGGILAGLGMMGIGGVIASVALGVPGRERTVRVGIVFALLGLAVSAGVGSLLFLQSPAVEMSGSATTHFACLAVACVVALLPAIGVTIFAGRAAAFRPLVLVIAAAAGTAALGAVTAQATCPYDDVRHLMLGHLLAPAVGALVLSLPLLVALRRSRRA